MDKTLPDNFLEDRDIFWKNPNDLKVEKVLHNVDWLQGKHKERAKPKPIAAAPKVHEEKPKDEKPKDEKPKHKGRH